MPTDDPLKQLDHRPFPLPGKPWQMTQTWSELLFAHWPVRPVEAEQFLPKGLTLDTFEGYAWVGVVPFRMSEVRPRWSPSLPWLSYFLELNVRTYVRRNGIAGVYFFSLDASNPIAVQVARHLYHLPYYDAKMEIQSEQNGFRYKSSRQHAGSPKLKFDCSYRAIGAVILSKPGSLEHFLTERYCLFTADSAGTVYRGNIHHAPWPLQPAEAEFRTNQMGDPYGFDFHNSKPLLHFASSLITVEWLLEAN